MQEYHVQMVKNVHPIYTEVPGSKSITNRALLIAALARGRSTLHNVLFSDDSRHFLAALKELGFCLQIDEDAKCVTIEGQGGNIPRKDATVEVGSAGTAARFLAALLGLSEGTYRMDSSEQMKKRPMKELLSVLELLGAEFAFADEEYHFPFEIKGIGLGQAGRSVGEIEIDIDRSSQFLSALLIASVLFPRKFTIHVAGQHGMAYVNMTLRMMEQFGFRAECGPDGRTFHIPADAAYQARDYVIEPDISAACYFYGAGAVLGTEVKVRHVHLECMQGDIAFLHILKDMGCHLCDEKDGVRMVPPAGKLRGGTWNLSAFSDQALTLAAVAPFTTGVKITGISHIRYQECDRLEAIRRNLKTIGAGCVQNGDGIIEIAPSEEMYAFTEKRIETFDDHRVAMAFSIPGLVLGNIVIENPDCCRKTFEGFFDALEKSVY